MLSHVALCGANARIYHFVHRESTTERSTRLLNAQAMNLDVVDVRMIFSSSFRLSFLQCSNICFH